MAQILIKGESVYQCTVCNRKIRVLTAKDGIDIVQRCTITYACRGKLLKVTNAEEVNTTPAFPVEIAGVQDWFQRRVVHTHTQPIKTNVWVVKHNLASKPLVYAYTSKQTEASATHTSVNVPAGAMWYKSSSGFDVDNPYNPSAAGLYEYNGTTWVTPKDTIPGGMIGQNIFEYQELTSPLSVRTVDLNTTEITFSAPQSGTAQCVALASQNTANPQRASNTTNTTPFKLSNNGELTIATTAQQPFITLMIKFKSSVVVDGINVVFNEVDNVASVASTWVGVGKIYVNGRTYTVRSFNLARTPPVPGVMSSGNVDPSNTKFTFENLSSNINENFLLLGNAPYMTVDRVYDKLIDIATLDKKTPEIYYSNGEVYVSQSKIQPVYPIIYAVD